MEYRGKISFKILIFNVGMYVYKTIIHILQCLLHIYNITYKLSESFPTHARSVFELIKTSDISDSQGRHVKDWRSTIILSIFVVNLTVCGTKLSRINIESARVNGCQARDYYEGGWQTPMSWPLFSFLSSSYQNKESARPALLQFNLQRTVKKTIGLRTRENSNSAQQTTY